MRSAPERLLVLAAAIASALSTSCFLVSAQGGDAQGGLHYAASEILQRPPDQPGVSATQNSTRVAIFHASDPAFIRNSPPEGSVRVSVVSAYLYCLNHGYTYLQVRNHRSLTGAGHFFKPGALVGMLEYAIDRFDVIVMVDADTLFMQPQRPLMPLMADMGFDAPGVVVAAAHAPLIREMKWAYSHGNHSYPPEMQVNTGFMVWKPSQRALHIARSWDTCAVDIPGCDVWKSKFFFDQGAFNTYIRWDVMAPGELLELPCSMFNGFDNRTFGPGHGTWGCNGTFLSHFWSAKGYFHKVHAGFMLKQLMKRIWHDVPALVLDVFYP